MTVDDFISHFGIKRRSGRYPWGSGDNPYQGEVKGFGKLNPSVQLKHMKSMNDEMNSWEYGVLIDGKVTRSSKDIDWSKYKTTPIKDVEKYHVGVCWDFVNYQHAVFKKNGYDDESHMFVMQIGDDPNNIVTHTFSTVNVGEKKYWFESSWLKHQGLHEVDSYDDVVKVLRKEYGEDYPYDVYKYNPDGLDKSLKQHEFFEAATKNLVYTSGKKVKHGEEVTAMTVDDFIAHFGIKRRSGRYPWGSGDRPYQGESKSFRRSRSKEDEEKDRRKDMIKRKNLRNMSIDDLKNEIERMKQEKQLKELVEDDISPGRRAIKKAAAEIGMQTVKQWVKGSIDYGINLALTDGKFDAKDLAAAVYPNLNKKKQSGDGQNAG